MTLYLNQKAQYQSLKSDKTDIYGNAEFNDSVEIACRREDVLTEVVDRAGKLVHSTITYFLDMSVNIRVGEKLDSRQVIALEKYVIGVGTQIGWEVYA